MNFFYSFINFRLILFLISYVRHVARILQLALHGLLITLASLRARFPVNSFMARKGLRTRPMVFIDVQKGIAELRQHLRTLLSAWLKRVFANRVFTSRLMSQMWLKLIKYSGTSVHERPVPSDHLSIQNTDSFPVKAPETLVNDLTTSRNHRFFGLAVL